MSNHGPSGGPYPDRPHDPWPGTQPHDPYGEPTDPWSGQDPWGGATPSAPPDGGAGSPTAGLPGTGSGYPEPTYRMDQGQPGQGIPGQGIPAQGGPGHGYPGADQAYSGPGAGYGPAVAFSEPAPAPRKGLSVWLIALLGVVALLVLGGTGIGILLANKDDPEKQASPTVTESAPPTDDPDGRTSPGPDSTGDPASGDQATDVRNVTAGQCLRNAGTDKEPDVSIAPCAPGTYEVLARFDGTADYKKNCGDGKKTKVPGYEFHYFYDSELDSVDFVLCLKRR